jgi:mRNA interferase MazF
VIERGGIYWADLGAPVGSRPAKRRPVLVISAATYNRSRLATVLAVVITSNTDLATMPGNVFLPASATGLPRDSVVNVTALVTLNKTDLSEHVGDAPPALLNEVDRGLREYRPGRRSYPWLTGARAGLQMTVPHVPRITTSRLPGSFPLTWR